MGASKAKNRRRMSIKVVGLERAEREVRAAVVDVAEPMERPVTKEDVAKLREDDLEELAEIAQRYVSA